MADVVQVAGHPGGIKTSDDGLWITKETTVYEAEFYDSVKANLATAGSSLNQLHRYLPDYAGSKGLSRENKNGEPLAEITIANLTRDFVRPNVLDVKLGSQMWDERASVEKRERMDAAYRGTTSWTDGMRLTGWTVWDPTSERTLATSKAFGKAIPSDMLPVGLRLFFGLGSMDDWERYAKVMTDAKEDLSGVGPIAQLEPVVASMIRKQILPELNEIVEALGQVELRMRGGSLLLVYEGDPEALQQKVAANDPSSLPARLKIIDFAHAQLREGEGPDEGVLKGVRTFQRLLKELL